MKTYLHSTLLIIIMLGGGDAIGQTITGAWQGKIGNIRSELKLVKKGDSLLGTSYYYTNRNRYRRYAVKGYFDPETNSVIWWDDLLLEEKGTGGMLNNEREPFLSVADFNCPGEDRMYLEGQSTDKDDKDEKSGPVDMAKVSTSMFPDEWDFIIAHYFTGANDPVMIDSVAAIALVQDPVPEGFEASPTPARGLVIEPKSREKIKVDPPIARGTPEVPTPSPEKTASSTAKDIPSIEKKFATRKNKLQTVIPITGSKIELRFYDNAQIDGDSIALFLNGKLLFKNIRLTDQPYTVVLNTDDLQADNELVMVAENLGSIPPNTSFMVALVGDKRYEARLYANENSSALIRFIKESQ